MLAAHDGAPLQTCTGHLLLTKQVRRYLRFWGMNGADDGIRTHDLLHGKQVLYH